MTPTAMQMTTSLQPQLQPTSYNISKCTKCIERHKLPHESKRSKEANYNNNISVESITPDHIDDLKEHVRGVCMDMMTRLRKWENEMHFLTPLIWRNIIAIFLLHIITVGWFVCDIYWAILPMWQTVLFGAVVGCVAGFGVTAGAHRYWCHRSYKAKLPLQIILLMCYTFAGQIDIFSWVRDHRVHHKFSESDADPHDVRRGFFFSHVGWLMMRKRPAVLNEGAKICMRDITEDPLVTFYDKYFNVFKVIFCFVLPTLVPVVCWGETWHYAVLSQPFLRYTASLNCTWAVNSFAHLWGNKPYNRHIMPVENWGVSIFAMGEGWHNYHHTFPWDYKAAELPYCLNLTTLILDMFAAIGWAYDMKQASPALVTSVANNRGEPQKLK